MNNFANSEMDAERRMEERNRQKADFDKYEPEAWKVSQLAATLLAGAINPDTGPCNMTEAIAAAQQILAAARKAVRQ